MSDAVAQVQYTSDMYIVRDVVQLNILVIVYCEC